MIDTHRIIQLQEAVRAHYALHAKNLPWRKSTNSYHILVSEIMSQQTQIERVVPKYLAWIDRFPNIYILALAPQADVLAMRSGLGFNRRAINLHKTAQTIVSTYNGTIPADPILLKKLPGIGEYTAHSICAFAYNMDVAVVDINTKRVVMHWFGYNEKELSDTDVRTIVMACLPTGRARDWYNALMDYGSQVLDASVTGIKSTPQSAFQGSRRQTRGNILKYLIAHGPTSMQTLSDILFSPHYNDVIDALTNEKIIIITDDILSLA